MEIDITSFFNYEQAEQYSASRAELGDNAGAITWNSAIALSRELDYLPTEDDRQAFRDYMAGFGAWDDEERAAWTHAECNALLIQMIAGDMREGDIGQNGTETTEQEWADYEARAERGTCSGRICRGNNGKVFFYVGD